MRAKVPFSYRIRPDARGALVVTVVGHLRREDWDLYQQSLELHVATSRRTGLVFDCSNLTGFHPSIARRHGEWVDRYRDQVDRIAVVATHPIIRFGVASARLVTSYSLLLFSELENAVLWAAAKDDGAATDV